MNVVVLTGRLVADPNLRYLEQDNAVCNLRLAVPREGKDNKEAVFLDCVASRSIGICMGETLKKGDRINVSGNIDTRTVQGKDGKNRVYTFIRVKRFDYVETKKAPAPAPEN